MAENNIELIWDYLKDKDFKQFKTAIERIK